MLSNYPKTKKALYSLFFIVLLIVGFGYWFFSLLPTGGSAQNLETTTVSDLPYLQSALKEDRGKILMVVTSTAEMGSSGKRTGYELTELARPYYVFMANGFQVDIASPKGGTPPAVLDDDDMAEYDYAFLNDSIAQHKIKNTIALPKVVAKDYEAVFFVGGKGAMYDFPENEHVQYIVAELYENNKVIGAVCHGPAALVNVTLTDGSLLVAGKRVSGFTNEEELLLIPKAAEIFPFLLEDKLESQGAVFNKTAVYLQQVSVDNRVVSGQNPWSTWLTAESVVRELGYTPKFRKTSPEENGINILSTYSKEGKKAAIAQLTIMMTKDVSSVDRILLATHCIVGIMQFRFGKTIDLLAILHKAKKLSE